MQIPKLYHFLLVIQRNDDPLVNIMNFYPYICLEIEKNKIITNVTQSKSYEIVPMNQKNIPV